MSSDLKLKQKYVVQVRHKNMQCNDYRLSFNLFYCHYRDFLFEIQIRYSSVIEQHLDALNI